MVADTLSRDLCQVNVNTETFFRKFTSKVSLCIEYILPSMITCLYYYCYMQNGVTAPRDEYSSLSRFIALNKRWYEFEMKQNKWNQASNICNWYKDL